MAKKQTQSIDLRPGKRFSSALSNENLRIGDKTAWAAGIAGTLDPTRTHLNFEVGKGGVIREVDKSRSIPRRIKEILDAHGIKDPNEGLTNEELKQDGRGVRTFASFILQGSHDTMRKLAFGEQEVSYSNPKADNSNIKRQREIELWARDMYDFMARKYGEENIAEFVVHLDETNPHVHCTIVPITPSGKLSFRKMFVGDKNDKYEFSRQTKAIWDEAAAIANKYGMERGDDKMTTGAKHKSYLQWMKEQIYENKKIIEEQRQQIYTINGQIRQAEKKLKGLTTMVSNLEQQRERIEIDIAALEEMAAKGEITNEEMATKLTELTNKMNDIDAKIQDKKDKLDEAGLQIRELAKRKHQLQNHYDELRRQINRELPTAQDKAIRDMNAIMGESFTQEAKNWLDKVQDYGKTLPPEQKKVFDNIFDNFIEGSVIEELAERGSEITAVAASLFLGYIDQATTFAQSSGGGGGGPGSGWGKKDDEDDEAYKRRCMIMGRMMMKPSGRKLKR